MTLCLRLLLMVVTLALAGPIPAMARPKADDAIERKVGKLLARMTREEKIGQLNFPSLAFPHQPQLDAIKAGRIGAMLNVVDPKLIREYATAARQSRLGIPLLIAIDAIYALRITFPPPIAWAATWRPALAEAASREVAREAAALGVNWTFAPMVDVSRDPRWGRVIEGAGEDSYLASAFAAARVRGYRAGGLATSVKHFVGYGAPEGGRDYNGAEISTSELYDRYLPPFRAAIDAGTDAVMASFNTINGIPVTASRRLITGLLKKQLDFDGFVTSDFVAIGELINHGVAANLKDAAAMAFASGIDLDMEGQAYSRHLAALIAEGRATDADLDDAVRRVLRVKFKLGLFDRTEDDFAKLPIDVPESEVRRVAREVARESFVLVKNEREILPITPARQTIALVGAAAENSNDHSWWGPAGTQKPATEMLHDALKSRLRRGQSLTFAPAFSDPCGRKYADFGKQKAVTAARDADIVVFVAIEDCEIQGEGVSRTKLDLTGVQQDMLDALAETGKPIVLVLETGRPLAIPEAERASDAILVTWHPGTEGRTAAAEVLLGLQSPSGKLPMTFPRAVGQIPIAYNSLPTSRPWTGSRYTSGYVDEAVTPLYPFGHGLSYTTFAYDALTLDRRRISTSGAITASVTVRNTGSRKGDEVVQLYVRQLVASRSRPVKELKGFEKISLKPGERKTVRLTIKAADLGFHDDAGRLLIEPGPFKVFAGGSSDTAVSAEFEMTR